MRLEDFDFDLPPELVAQFPPQRRGDSRLLVVDGATGALADRLFAELPALLSPADLLVFNDTRVMRARLFGRKDTGGKVELLIERVLDGRHALALVRASHAPQAGALLTIGDAQLRVLGRSDDLYHLELVEGDDLFSVLEHHGEMPLPPYIARPATAEDEGRYQTVYARAPGAVAAPTAGLHFDAAMLERLEKLGVRTAFLTLHVGSGTFQPVRTDRIEAHRMHAERYWIPAETVAAVADAKARNGRVVAVGTTSLRALEAAAEGGSLRAGSGETDLFIQPGFEFRVVDALLTNFHLPRSTLIMLVAAFAGLARIQAAYRHAIAHRYRFFSYGDASFLTRARPGRAGAPD